MSLFANRPKGRQTVRLRVRFSPQRLSHGQLCGHLVSIGRLLVRLGLRLTNEETQCATPY
jgi:hypothetical protein